MQHVEVQGDDILISNAGHVNAGGEGIGTVGFFFFSLV